MTPSFLSASVCEQRLNLHSLFSDLTEERNAVQCEISMRIARGENLFAVREAEKRVEAAFGFHLINL